LIEALDLLSGNGDHTIEGKFAHSKSIEIFVSNRLGLK